MKDELYTTYDCLLKHTIDTYLSNLDNDINYTIDQIRDGLIVKLRSAISSENNIRERGDRIRQIQTLPNYAIANAMMKLYKIAVINLAGHRSKENSELYIYRTKGEKKGLYDSDLDYIRRKIREFSFSITSKSIEEVLLIIRDEALIYTRNQEKDLVIVKNGIFNYKTKILEDFDHDKVFITKPNINYPEYIPENKIIMSEEDNYNWDIESWMLEIAGGDTELANAFWEHISAVLRPNVSWNKSIWYYSTSGNNGKGSLLSLIRNLLGEGAYASVSLDEMGSPFGLSEIIRTQAILTDENSVGTYIDKAANLKAIITGDVIQLNMKYKNPISFKFQGVMIQCLNEFPKIKDKTDSLYRRQLFVPFKKSFTGHEKKYIKNIYLKRNDVLEYVLYKALNTNFYELSEPSVSREAFREYKRYNDPIRQFSEDILPELKWDLVPFTFLYDLYRSWGEKEGLNKFVRKTGFIDSLLNIIKDDTMWECEDKGKRIRPSNRMDNFEPLINEYNLTDWMSRTYKGNNTELLCKTELKSHYSGIIRLGSNEN